MPKSLKAAVITGDIIASSKLTPVKRKKLQNRLSSFIKKTTETFPDFKAEQFRGDSLQYVFTKKRAAALRSALSLYCYLAAEDFKIRQSIGLGEITFSTNNVTTSDGTAFRISGENVDELKKRAELFNIASVDTVFNDEWKVHSVSLNYILERLSNAQAEAVYLQLQNTKQEDIARALHISQPSVHQRLQAAGWNVMNKILQRFEATITLL